MERGERSVEEAKTGDQCDQKTDNRAAQRAFG